jgi:hypothetical protein
MLSLHDREVRYYNHVGQLLSLHDRVVKVLQPCWPDLLSLHDREGKVYQPCWPDLLSLHERGKVLQPCWPDDEICCHYMIERVRYINHVGQMMRSVVIT